MAFSGEGEHAHNCAIRITVVSRVQPENDKSAIKPRRANL